MEFWVYMLRCADRSLYVGHTDDLERRMAEHSSGEFRGYTALHAPVTLVFSQPFPSRDEAIVRERQIKNWTRAKKEALARGDWAEVSRLARGRNRAGALKILHIFHADLVRDLPVG